MSADLDIAGVTWVGPPVDDAGTLGDTPPDLRALLQQVNGFILRGGALHVRGAARAPAWHSLREVWYGSTALSGLYPSCKPEDIPFAQDCVGDQFILRHERVWRLSAEDGTTDSLEMDLMEFLRRAAADPVQFLSAAPLVAFTNDGGSLAPGKLLCAFPPLCSKQAADGVSLSAVAADELLRTHADLARKLRASA